MKTNFWRISLLALTLLMLFAIVACANDGEPAATGKATQGATTAAATTTEPATTEPVTTEPVTTEPVTTEPVFIGGFSNVLPAEFAGEKVIVIEGANCEEGCTTIDKIKDTQYNLFTVPAAAGASANGCIKLIAGESEAAKQDQVFHYYLNSTLKVDGVAVGLENAYIRWSFNVTEAGTYKIASYNRVKNDGRNGYIQFDDQAKFEVSYDLKENFDKVVDGYAGAYWIWDQTVTLEPGDHTLTYTLKTEGSIHWRTFYLVKVEATESTPAA